jgi:hypothetical protein
LATGLFFSVLCISDAATPQVQTVQSAWWQSVAETKITDSKINAFAKNHKMAKQKFRPTRPGGFSGAKAYMLYVEVLKKRRNAGGRTFCDTINYGMIPFDNQDYDIIRYMLEKYPVPDIPL